MVNSWIDNTSIAQFRFKPNDIVVKRAKTGDFAIRARRHFRIDHCFRVITVDGSHVCLVPLQYKGVIDLHEEIVHGELIMKLTPEQIADWVENEYNLDSYKSLFRRQDI